MSNEKNVNTDKCRKYKKLTKNVDAVKGELTYEDKVIQKIIGLSLEKVDGLLA